MSNPLFSNQSQSGNQGIFDLIQQLKGSNSQGVFNQMYQNNPQFRDFANAVKGKTPEEAFQQYSLDFNAFKNIIN